MAKKKAKKAKKKKAKRKPSSSDNTGRDPEGKFSEGNQLSVGNKGKSSEKAKALKKALIDVVSEKDIKAIVGKMKTQAIAGDNYARKELFDRLWGRAIQEVDISENTANTLVDIFAKMCGNGNE